MNPGWRVIKFGGTSVSDLASWSNIATILRAHRQQGYRVILVCSAPHRVSNELHALFDIIQAGVDYQSQLTLIQTIFLTLCDELSVNRDHLLGEIWPALLACLDGVRSSHPPLDASLAQLMARGELMLTQLAAQYLQQQALPAAWMDARDVLVSTPSDTQSTSNHYLNARAHTQYDSDWLTTLTADIYITQGFIASDDEGRTVLLGRGGSDVSAALLAVKAKAERCEIWTDVPGIFTANPHHVADARHVSQLSYDEALEIALMGAKVLHPNTLKPLKQQNIPLWVKDTKHVDRQGTTIVSDVDGTPIVKAVSVNQQRVVLSMSTQRMWQQAGFLADIFACFKQHDISIDLLATSQASITVTLDKDVAIMKTPAFNALLSDLKQFTHVAVIAPCASVNLIGSKVRQCMHRFSSLFDAFKTTPVHLMSQAANDLSFTVVVDQSHAKRIEQLAHELLVEQSVAHTCFGDRLWHQEPLQITEHLPWWWSQREALQRLPLPQSPAYIYHSTFLTHQAQGLLQCQSFHRVLYAMKANSNPEVLACFYQLGLGFECVSIFEVRTLMDLFPSIDPKRILFTPNFAAESEYREAMGLGVNVTIDNLHPLKHWPSCFKGQSILLRVDPGFGVGHHRFVETGGNQSKFGVSANDFEAIKALADANNTTIIGLHAHSGSGIFDISNWVKLANTLLALRSIFSDVRVIDLGGGLGVPEKAGQPPLDLAVFDQALVAVTQQHPDIEFWLEPGRYLVSEAGVLLTTVTQVKHKPSLTFIGVDAGMHTLIRPALYGAYHQIINLTRWDQPNIQLSHIVGPICESGDILGRARWMPNTQEGDRLLIANVGAYGASMSSRYNLRPFAHEQMCDMNE